MLKKIVTLVAAGAIGATSFAVAGPALASSTAPAAQAVTSQVDRIKQALAGLVSDKTISQAQADKVAATLGSADVGRGGHGGFGGFGVRQGRGGLFGLATAATTLKMTETELRAALEGGKTLAQVANDQKVPVNTLVDAMVKAQTARITQGVTDGRLTQAQADTFTSHLRAAVTARVNGVRPARPLFDRDGTRGTAPTTPPTPSASTSTA